MLTILQQGFNLCFINEKYRERPRKKEGLFFFTPTMLQLDCTAGPILTSSWPMRNTETVIKRKRTALLAHGRGGLGMEPQLTAYGFSDPILTQSMRNTETTTERKRDCTVSRQN